MKDETKPSRGAGAFDQTTPAQTPDKKRGGWRVAGVLAVGGAVAIAIAVTDARSWRPLVDQTANWAAVHGFQALTAVLEPSPPQQGDWAVFTETERRAVALAYGYDGPVRDGLFARWLDLHPEKRADFLARYMPSSVLRPAPRPAVQAPARGDWAAMSEAEREAAARTFGYDGPVRDGLFARWLEARPEKKAEFADRYLPKPPAASPAFSSPPLLQPPAVQAPARGDWAAMSEAEREAAARAFGYDGPVRDGLFARWLEIRPEKKAEFARRYLPKPPSAPALPAVPAATPPLVAAELLVRPPPPKPAPSPAPSPVSKIAARPAKPAIGDAHYTVRVGSFLDRANAETTATRLTHAGHKVYASDWADAKGRTWRVVRVGDYASAAEAQRVVAALERLGVSGQATRLK